MSNKDFDRIPTFNAQVLRLEKILPGFNYSGLIMLSIPQNTDTGHRVIRLGHFAERIFVNLLKVNFPGNTLMTNIQITNNGRTLGELDVLLIHEDRIEHIEFCYKIYLFDPHLSDKEFECWIGPNRRDALQYKVDKLLKKQLPLFWQPETVALLRKKIENFDVLERQQSVCFLGQLYVPLESFQNQESFLYGEPDGFYIYEKELNQFEGVQWYIPHSKIDWILSPILSVEWMETSTFIIALKAYHIKSSNPLCWMKTPNNELFKCFVVNWEQRS